MFCYLQAARARTNAIRGERRGSMLRPGLEEALNELDKSLASYSRTHDMGNAKRRVEEVRVA